MHRPPSNCIGGLAHLAVLGGKEGGREGTSGVTVWDVLGPSPQEEVTVMHCELRLIKVVNKSKEITLHALRRSRGLI